MRSTNIPCLILLLLLLLIFFSLVIIYRPHLGAVGRFASLVLRPLHWSSLVFSCASDRSFIIERQVCSLRTKPQVSTTLHYTITVCCNRTTHSQHCLPASVQARELILNSRSGDRGIELGPFAPAADNLYK